jgi:hypothetical protein
LYRNAERCLGGFLKGGECLKKDKAGWKEIKPAVTFPGIGLQIILLLLRLDYIILVIPKTSITENGREYNEKQN